MIEFKSYGSSSRGNCYLITDNETTIVIDCGVKNSDRFIDYSKVDGILLTHSHL